MPRVVALAVLLTSMLFGCSARTEAGALDGAAAQADPSVVDSRIATADSARVAHGAVRARTVEAEDPALAAALLELLTRRSGETLSKVGQEYRRLRIFDAAQTYFTEALALNKRDAVAYDGRARVMRDAGFPGLALGDAHRATRYAPDSAIAANTLGTVLEAIGLEADARAQYVRALTLDPDASYALNNVCHTDTRAGKSTAVAACQRAAAGALDPVRAHNSIALAYAVAGDFVNARREFSIDATPASAAYNMGVVYMAARQYKQARESFVRAQDIGWRASDVTRRLKQISAMQAQQGVR